MQDTAGEARTNSSVIYSYEPPHMAKQKQEDQHEHTYSSCVRIRDVALKTCQNRWMIGRSGERGSGIYVLAARHDDDDTIPKLPLKQHNRKYKENLKRRILNCKQNKPLKNISLLLPQIHGLFLSNNFYFLLNLLPFQFWPILVQKISDFNSMCRNNSKFCLMFMIFFQYRNAIHWKRKDICVSFTNCSSY